MKDLQHLIRTTDLVTPRPMKIECEHSEDHRLYYALGVDCPCVRDWWASLNITYYKSLSEK